MQTNVLDYFEHTVQCFANKIALVDKNGAYSFAELYDRVMASCRLLGKFSVEKNHPVCIFLPRSIDSIAAMLATLYKGGCYAPLDLNTPPARLANIVTGLGPALYITLTKYQTLLQSAGVAPECILTLDDSQIDTGNAEVCRYPVEMIDTDPAYIIHTSGSTGVPKGVVISHRGIIDYIDWARNLFAIDAQVIIGNQAPFYFDNSTLDIYLCLATGATLVLIPEELFMFPVCLLAYMVEQQINFVFWVPSMLVMVANNAALEKVTHPPLTTILFAGEVMPIKQLNYWRAQYPEAIFANLYGPTEITVDCTYYIVNREFADHESLPIGVPCRNSDVFILDGDVRVVQANTLGELCVRGSSLALGYWNAPEKTRAVFTQNPLNPHYPEAIYHTGDLVYLNERNELIFAGRRDSQIKHLGYRIELGEIESAVSSLEGPRQVCVLYNQQEKKIILCYEAAEEIPSAYFRKHLAELLPKYMLPTVFLLVDTMPLNANGKIDRLTLAEKFT